MNKPKQGDVITIYAKPLTHDQPEGRAKLVKLLQANSGTADFKFWEVEFIEEPGTNYQRWVYPS